jgi:repressor of nif and glnA expression
MILTPDDNEILERLSATGSTPDSVANLLRCAGYKGMTGIAIRRRLQKLEKEKAVERVRRPDIKKTCWAPAIK